MKYTIHDLLLFVTVCAVLFMYELGWCGEVLGIDDTFRSFWTMMASLVLLFVLSVGLTARYFMKQPKKLSLPEVATMTAIAIVLSQLAVALLASPVYGTSSTG